MKKKSSLFICILLLSLFAVTDTIQAQTNRRDIPVPTRRKRPKPINKELSFGLRLNTNGWDIFMDKGHVKPTDRTTDYFYNLKFWRIDFGEKKNPQEKKRSNTIANAGDAAKPFIYGKVSNFYTLKFGYGNRKLIGGKPPLNNEVEPRTVSVHWVYLGGITLGLEKPYYIDTYISKNNIKTINYTDSTHDAFLDQQNIAGSSGFSTGLGQTKIVPGIHGSTALHFDFAGSKQTVLAVEAGINVELYSRAIAMMANQKNVPYFVNGYVSLQIGKRWAQKK